MTNLEPTDVGPVVGGHVRASNADRQQVIGLLDAALTEGRLTSDEHDERRRDALNAQVFDDLVPLTRDLVALDETPQAPQWTNQPATASTQDPDLIFTIFSGTSRKGRWHARRHISVLTLFGGTTLDFNEATFTDGVCEVSVFCLFGGVDIKVPEGIEVSNQIIAVFGGANSSRITPHPGAPRVIIKGFVGFGGVDARGPKPVRG